MERPESEWLRFENNHEPLITMEVWELAREVRRHKRRAPKKIEAPTCSPAWCTAPTAASPCACIGRGPGRRIPATTSSAAPTATAARRPAAATTSGRTR
ncbi:recombinase family protein [Anaerotruncus colihominis]|uniref:recombinase family protein n=1 Tax=Anaerotruncus colihominis TaxID=169435 RepID=UPI003C6BE6E3